MNWTNNPSSPLYFWEKYVFRWLSPLMSFEMSADPDTTKGGFVMMMSYCSEDISSNVPKAVLPLQTNTELSHAANDLTRPGWLASRSPQ